MTETAEGRLITTKEQVLTKIRVQAPRFSHGEVQTIKGKTKMTIETKMGTMASGMVASKEMIDSQKCPADLNKSIFSCDPDVARKIAKGILDNCRRTVLLEPRALPGRQQII